MEAKAIAFMTIDEFINGLSEAGLVLVSKNQPKAAQSPEDPESLDFSDSSRYGRGLRAICDRYKVSNLTAQRLKDGPLSPAVYQGCRRGKFWIDFQKADKIMTERKNPKGNTRAVQVSI